MKTIKAMFQAHAYFKIENIIATVMFLRIFGKLTGAFSFTP
jgi:hypothetical protein